MATHNVFIHIFPQYTLFFYILRGTNAFVLFHLNGNLDKIK